MPLIEKCVVEDGRIYCWDNKQKRVVEVEFNIRENAVIPDSACYKLFKMLAENNREENDA